MNDCSVLFIENNKIMIFTDDSYDLLCLFFEDDQRIISSQEKVDASQKVFRPYISGFDFDKDGPIKFMQSNVGTIKKRLAFLGIDNDYVRENFNTIVSGLLLELAAGNIIQGPLNKLAIGEQISLLQELDFNDWLGSTWGKLELDPPRISKNIWH